MEDYSSKEEKFLEDKEIPDEVKEKLKNLKNNLEKFKDEVLKKYQRYVIGIALLPPNKEAKKEEKDKVSVFVLVDDSDNLKVEKDYPREKIFEAIDKIANEVNKNISPQTMMLSELKESCFDGKYEVLQLIGLSAIIYDKGMLGALKVSEIHKTMSIKKFEKYVLSYVAVGSLFRSDSNPNDIDVFVIIDDTDVKKMSRAELKDKLRAIIQGMGQEAAQIAGIKASFHVQTYILTDFWDSVKDANPVIFTFLRDGVHLYDRGVFQPWKLLLKMGRIKPSPEAIDLQMDIGDKLLERVKGKLISVVAEDLYYAVLNPAQAILMAYGVNPPTPLETISLLREIFVKKEKLLEEKYVKILEDIRDYYKKIEHQKIKEIEGKEVDRLLKDTKDFLERIKKLFKEIEKKKENESIKDIHNACVAITKDMFSIFNIENNENIESELKKLSEKGEIPIKYYEIFKRVNNLKKQKLSKIEGEKIKREAREYIKVMMELVQRRQNFNLEGAKLRIKYAGNKFGGIYLVLILRLLFSAY